MTAEDAPCVRRRAVSGEPDPARWDHLFPCKWPDAAADDGAPLLLCYLTYKKMS